MPTQVDGSWLDVNIHQVVDNLTLDVILDPVDEKPATNIDDFDEGQISEKRQQTGNNECLVSLMNNVELVPMETKLPIYLSC